MTEDRIPFEPGDLVKVLSDTPPGVDGCNVKDEIGAVLKLMNVTISGREVTVIKVDLNGKGQWFFEPSSLELAVKKP